METWQKADKYLAHLVGALASIAAIVGYLRGDEGLVMQVIAITGTALFLASVVYILVEKRRTAISIYDAKGRLKKPAFPLWGKITLAIVPALWLVVLAYLITRQPTIPSTPTETPTPTLTNTPTPPPTSTLSPTPTDTPTSTPTPTPTITPTPTPPCPYQVDTDAETIVQLIHAEAQAVLNEDITIIQAIFAGDATIWDAARDERWEDPIARYVALFANTDFIEDVHFEVQPAGPGITESVAYFTSGSSGRFTSVDNPSQVYEFYNEPCSDHWTFGRNSAGCWVITDFTFNACPIPFPPE